jgi:DNA-binding SARP family transcriptional activator
MRSGRLRGYLDATGVLLSEMVLFAFFWEAGGLLGTVDLSHLALWLQQSGPQATLTALFRLLGIVVSGWLLVGTAAYGAGVLTGSARLRDRSRRMTPRLVRRTLDTLAVASVAASSIGSSAALAAASAPSHGVAVVRPVSVERPQGRAPVAREVTSPVVASVSVTAVGRHFPHPGAVSHGQRAPVSAPADDDGAPSLANGFAGLAPGTKVVVVQPGDCLSVLAARHLGDWRLDTDIGALNFGRPQADGRALVDDHWIYPGWVLVMPSDAIGATVVGGTAAPAAVQGGAEPARPASPGRPPGMVAPATKVRGGAKTTKGGGGGRPGQGGRGARPGTGREALPSPEPVAPHAPVGRRLSPGPVAGTPSAPADPVPGAAQGLAAHTALARSGERRHDVDKSDNDEAAVLVIGAMAAAAALWRLDGMRRELRHARPRGWAVVRNRAPVEAAERRARAIAGHEALRWADLGVRYLTGLVEQLSGQDHKDLPSLVLVKVGGRGLEIVLSPPPEGRLGWFSPDADKTGLVLDADIEIEELEVLAADHWSAWPALVSLGETEAGTVLMNLEYAGSLSVEGESHAVRGALAGILLQLVSQPWSQEMLAGLYSVGEHPLDDRLGPVQQVAADQAIDLAEKLDRIAGAREELAGDLTLSALRAIACEALPNVVVAFAGTPGGALQCLAEAAVPQRSGVVLAGAGPVPGAGWRLVLGDGHALLEGKVDDRGVALKLKVGWDLEEVGLVAEALGTASDRDGAMVLTGADSAVMADEPACARGEVEILVLGPVDVAGGEMGAVEPSRRMAALGLLAYMAIHDCPVSADQLASSLWPLDATKDNLNGPQRKTVMNVVSRARAVLGYSAGGRERLVHTPQGYRLSGDVSSDWTRFEGLVRRARTQAPPEAMAGLRRALELVRGEPFSGAVSSQFFEWVASEHLDLTLSAKIVDIAEELGELALAAGDYDTVMWAVEKGLRLEPTREEMFRLWMHALGRMGRPGSVDEVYRRLKLVLRQRIHPLQEPQAGSYAVWRTYTAGELTAAPR